MEGIRAKWTHAQSNLFHSARLKLTAFYFAVLVVFCLLLTFGVRAFAEHELDSGYDAQRGAVQKLFEQYSDPDTYTMIIPGAPGDRYFTRAQQRQADKTRQNLNRDFVILDLVLLAMGAVLSYWYAGRTLRPIEQAHEQQKRFTSDASHELRTPLASMKLENEIFLRQKKFNEADARLLIQSNLQEVNRLEQLSANLLALNQYEHGSLDHAPEAVGELVQAAVARIKKNKTAKNIRFVQTITPAKVDVNRDSVIEMLTILLDNAAKYGPQDGVVEIDGKLVNERYSITIRDYGPGIAEADLPHIFERMYRGDKARSSKVSGYGIGLSLAEQIAAANDATISASNAEDGGAQFVVTLQ